MTVGEALNHVMQSDPAIEAAIPNARMFIGLRNRIVHGYDTVRPEIIWDVARTHINDLIARVSDLLADVPPPER